MDLQDAIEQYVDMLTLGSEAVVRLADGKLDAGRLANLRRVIDEIVERAGEIREIAGAPRCC